MCPAGAPGEVHPGGVFLEHSGMHPGAPGCTPECFQNTPPGCISPGAPRCISELPQDTPKKVYPRHVLPGSSGEHSGVSAGCIQKSAFSGSSQMHPGAPEKHIFLEASYSRGGAKLYFQSTESESISTESESIRNHRIRINPESESMLVGEWWNSGINLD